MGSLFAFQVALPLANVTEVVHRPRKCCVHAVATKSTSFSLEHEVGRRRNFAIISHPDSGKSTLTEKLLLYGGAIQQAGSVRAHRNQRGVTSDAMAIEQERGISITSTVLTFEYEGHRINIADTPGHSDFGEDTFRTLTSCDQAVMLIDGAKGLEPQTRKLFEICRMRNVPLFSFVNKLDRPCLSPFEICDQIEQEFGIFTFPIVWPIGDGDRFRGVYERSTKLVHLFEKGERGKKAKQIPAISFDNESLPVMLGDELYGQLVEDVEILDSMWNEFDYELVKSGDLTPLFFGSAMSNFGVELFLKRFLELGRAPPIQQDTEGEIVRPHTEQFTAQVFKLQANMDPKHRDRLAFVRVYSGRFFKGMKVVNSRTNKSVTLTRPQSLFAADRFTVEEAFAGDVIGLNNPGVFTIGDTLFSMDGNRVQYDDIPSFSPELFCYIKNPNPSAYKNFKKGLAQLLEEGAVQMMRAKQDQGNEDPILAAVGQLQFEVVQRRLKDEYNVESKLEPLPYALARWVTGPGDPWAALEACGRIFSVFQAKDRKDRPVLLFKNQWGLNNFEKDQPDLELAKWIS